MGRDRAQERKKFLFSEEFKALNLIYIARLSAECLQTSSAFRYAGGLGGGEGAHYWIRVFGCEGVKDGENSGINTSNFFNLHFLCRITERVIIGPKALWGAEA